VLEYYEALDRRVKSPNFPLVVMLLEGKTAPGLPFLRQLHWIVSADPSSKEAVTRLFDAAAGGGTTPKALWRYSAPYRGLAAMTEEDGDYRYAILAGSVRHSSAWQRSSNATLSPTTDRTPSGPSINAVSREQLWPRGLCGSGQ
jgi:hypothetical protein